MIETTAEGIRMWVTKPIGDSYTVSRVELAAGVAATGSTRPGRLRA